MKNILVPVGASTNALNHLQYAIDFAKAFQARLYVVEVNTKKGAKKNINKLIAQESKSYLTNLVSQLDTKGIEIIIKTLKVKLIDNIELTCKTGNIDLILIEPKTNSTKEEVYLGRTSGKIIKQTKTPALIIPENHVFRPVSNVLMAIKLAIIKKKNGLIPLKFIKDNFDAEINLLLVKTPYYKNGDYKINEDLASIVNKIVESKNSTTYQGVIEHIHTFNPDMLCVVKRNRGFFTKILRKNTILKIDFYSNLPVLVLNGLR